MRQLLIALTALTLTGAVLTGCSVSTEDLEQVSSMPAVHAAESECFELTCRVEVTMSTSASGSEIAAVLHELRGLRHAGEVVLTVPAAPGGDARDGGATADLDVSTSPAERDRPIGDLLAWAAGTEGVDTLHVGLGVSGTLTSSVWEHARAAWDLTAALGDADLELVSDPEGRPQLLRGRGAFPAEAVALAADLSAGRGFDGPVTGVAVEPGRVMVGTPTHRSALALRAALARDPRSADLAVGAVATFEILEVAQTSLGQAIALDEVVETLEAQPGVRRATHGATGLDVRVDSFAAASRAVAALRETGASQRGRVLVVSHGRGTVMVTENGDDAVLDLAAALVEAWPDATVDIGPSTQTESGVTLDVAYEVPGPSTGSAPSPAAGVRTVARILTDQPGTARHYLVVLAASDTDGRTRKLSWKVDREGGSLRLGELDGLPENDRLVRREWRRAVG